MENSFNLFSIQNLYMIKHLPNSTRTFLLAAALTGSYGSFAQNVEKATSKVVPQAAMNLLKTNKQALRLADSDIADVSLSSSTVTKHNGIKHLYLQQRYQGIEIHNAITTVNLTQDDQVVNIADRFYKNINTKAKAPAATLTAEAAVAAAAKHLQISVREPLTMKGKVGGESKEVLFSTGGISLEPIPAKLVYQPMEDGSLKLAWEVSIYELDAQNWWVVRVDASTGKFLDKDNLVDHCEFDNAAFTQQLAAPFTFSAKAYATRVAAPFVETGTYNVLPLPVESPNHGSRTLVNSSAVNAKASPLGWHNTGSASYTITRGNNVFAYDDPNNTGYDGRALDSFGGYSPDGGAALNFDFPIDYTKPPVTYRDAAITNLFYWNNIIHDVFYQYGFDELSGNFQANNFGKGGAGADQVMAEAQDSRNITTTRNNANFATPVDGGRPRMQMYLWTGVADANMFRIISPSALAGSYTAREGTFSKPLTETPVTGKLVLAQTVPTTTAGKSEEGCGAFTNPAAIAGNIAVVYRGSCGFADKVQNAQIAGAIGVVVINSMPGDPIVMGGTPAIPLPAITIPAVMISQATGQNVRALLDAGTEVTVALKNSSVELDGDLDNGIITHEYGHGISNRLTGGPNNTSCLGNAEQAGEGWSDYFGLMLTMKPGDTRDKVRGIGTYASGQPTTAGGIRPAPYSPDFGVNNYTYAATNNTALTQPHGIGFVWATMLWDLTWDLIDKYGYDPNVYNGKGGNNLSIQLVIDGLKLQACRPGFVDSRDAILLADRNNNGGANQELIWRAFAKRGLGYSAKQGSTNSRLDQVEAFDVPPVFACVAPTITVSPATAGFKGAAPNTIYLGYGPQSVKLSAISSDTTYTYTWTPATGLSNPNIANPVFTPTAAGSYTFTVTAVNSNQCTRTASVRIEVLDVRCGNKNDKVEVCHNGKALCISPNAVADHLNHGDMVGACQSPAAAGFLAEDLTTSLNDLTLTVTPNPTSTRANLAFTLPTSGKFRLEVLNIQGALVRVLGEGTGSEGQTYSYEFSKDQLASGIYMARLITEKGNKFTKIILQD